MSFEGDLDSCVLGVVLDPCALRFELRVLMEEARV